MADLFYDT